jgi:two-component system sensor histidine kinase SenX3
VCFAVSDDGVGLTPREASRVFDRFYQADRRLSRGGGGCGLGLSIVRLIAGAHGGEVAVESRRGQGSTFTLRLPAGPREEPPP